MEGHERRARADARGSLSRGQEVHRSRCRRGAGAGTPRRRVLRPAMRLWGRFLTGQGNVAGWKPAPHPCNNGVKAQARTLVVARSEGGQSVAAILRARLHLSWSEARRLVAE